MYRGKILDGRNRYRACLLKGINPTFHEELPADPYAFFASANLHRRHLEIGQRAMIAAQLATMKQGDNQHSPAGETSQGKAAELLNVGEGSVERAAEVIKQGAPDLVDAVKHGDVRVSAAAEFAKQNPPLDQARLIAEHGSPAAAVDATIRTKADKAGKRRPAPKPNTAAAADRADPEKLIVDAIEQLVRIDVRATTIARMSEAKRVSLLTQLARANVWLNKTAIEIATLAAPRSERSRRQT